MVVEDVATTLSKTRIYELIPYLYGEYINQLSLLQ
jgi:hypothetical protein